MKYLPSAVFIAQVLVGPSKQLKQIFQIEHNIVKNGTQTPLCVHFFVQLTYFHEREGDGKRNILLARDGLRLSLWKGPF